MCLSRKHAYSRHNRNHYRTHECPRTYCVSRNNIASMVGTVFFCVLPATKYFIYNLLTRCYSKATPRSHETSHVDIRFCHFDLWRIILPLLQILISDRQWSCTRLNIKTFLSCIAIFSIIIRRSWYRLIFKMWILILIRWWFYIETAPRKRYSQYSFHRTVFEANEIASDRVQEQYKAYL